MSPAVRRFVTVVVAAAVNSVITPIITPNFGVKPDLNRAHDR